jgi:hypothetical protein
MTRWRIVSSGRIARICFAAAVLAPTSTWADDGIQLSGEQIKQNIIGHKVNAVSPKGKKWSGIYLVDGTAEWDGGSTGTWRLDGDLFCDFPKDDKEYCSYIVKTGENAYHFFRDGKKGSRFSLE